jgi:hypothetical protein
MEVHAYIQISSVPYQTLNQKFLIGIKHKVFYFHHTLRQAGNAEIPNMGTTDK